MRISLVAILFSSFIAAIAAQSASAGQTCPERPADEKKAKQLAGKWWRAAEKSFAAKRYEDALREWRCSNSLVPHPLALNNLCRAAEGAEKHAQALKYYEDFLKAMPNAPNRREVELSIRVLKTELERRTKPKPEPEPEPEPKPKPKPEPEPEPEPKPEPKPESPPIVHTETDAPTGDTHTEHDLKKTHRPGRTSYILGWTSLSITGGLAILAGVFGGITMKAKKAVEDSEVDTPWRDNLDQHAKNYDNYRIATGVCTGIAAAALTSSIIFFILSKGAKRKEAKPDHTVSITPTVSSSQLGLDFRVSF